MKVHLVLKSSNSKVGPIPVTTTEEASCPSTCPLKNAGCYAKAGPLALHWRKVPDRGMEWNKFCEAVKSFPPNQFWRHNQAGDLPHTEGVINVCDLSDLVIANMGKRGYTYTHHDITNEWNVAQIKAANLSGFTINLSADNIAEADKMKALNIGPVCVVLPSDCGTAPIITPANNRIIICPSYKEGVTCESCKLCQKSNRIVIIGFPAHGTQKKKASAAVKN